MGKVFKDYPQGQTTLFPPSLDEMVPRNHPVRIVNDVIDRLDLSSLLSQYKGGGATSYHPRMLLKMIVFGYLSNIYSSRKLESCGHENIFFMWLSGMQRPDHNTLNRFRSERLKGVIREVFVQVVGMLAESGHVSLQRVFTDGTKIEANANRYTFVWGKAIQTNRSKMGDQLSELWDYAESVAQEELKDHRPTSFDPVDPKVVAETVEKINNAIAKKKVPPKLRAKVGRARRNWPEKVAEYNLKEEILAGRGSYSVTDTDATFMRMKEDHLGNGQLKPAYNLQFSTSSQYILHYTVHSSPGDTTTLIPHLASFNEAYGVLPGEITADAGYGSEENYLYLEDKSIDAYVKYNTYYNEQRKKPSPKDAFKSHNLHYNAKENAFYCPMGQKMRFIGTVVQKTKTGFEQSVSMYQAQRCTGCPLRGACHDAQGDRIIKVNHRLDRLRGKARELLGSERGMENRKQRPVDVEPAFGQLKHNWGFRRFSLRGKQKVEVETGLLAVAHNLKKMSAKKE